MSYNPTYMNFISLIRANALFEVKDFLNKNNININIRPTYYDHITVYYSKDSNLDIIKYMLEEKNGNILAFLNTTELDEYILGVENLIKLGLNPKILYENSFIHSCSQGLLDIAEYSFKKNININAYNDLALFLSCKNNQVESLKYLINKGFKIKDDLLEISSYKACYSNLIKYPKDENNFQVFKFLINNFKFNNLLSISDKIIQNLTTDFFKEYSNKDNYSNVYEIIKDLIFIHNIECTEKTINLLNNDVNLINLFKK